MITSLTKEQSDRFPEFVDKWTRIGLSTEPADRPRAESALRAMYAQAGFKHPKIVWCGSPFGNAITRAIVTKSSHASVGASVGASGYGQHDANWIGFVDYFRRVCLLAEQTEKLDGLTELCESAGWFLPHQKLCWVSERHNIVRKNERNQLHCEDGPALAYPDGWQLWRLRGAAVDEQIVMRPETQTVEQINGEQNAEVKRHRIERFGTGRYLTAINAKSISERQNDIEGTREVLYQADGLSILACACPSTAKVFYLEVPPAVTTCEQAQKYLSSGLSGRIISAA